MIRQTVQNKTKFVTKHIYTSLMEKNIRQIEEIKLKNDEVLGKLIIQFNAHGVINQKQYFLSYYKNAENIIQYFGNIIRNQAQQLQEQKQQRALEGGKVGMQKKQYSYIIQSFKFKFIGWNHINPQPFLGLIAQNILCQNFELNLSNIRGSPALFQKVLQLFYIQRTEKYKSIKYKSISFNFANWDQNYQTFKLWYNAVLYGTDLLSLEFSGWGKDIDKFFGLDNESNDYNKNKIQNIETFHKQLQNHFVNEVITSVEVKVKLDFRSWHKQFNMKRLQNKLQIYLKKNTMMPSIMRNTKTTSKEKIFSVELLI